MDKITTAHVLKLLSTSKTDTKSNIGEQLRVLHHRRRHSRDIYASEHGVLRVVAGRSGYRRARWRRHPIGGPNLEALLVAIALLLLGTSAKEAQGSERMVRLCIASVDPAKLSSQCVMCNRREFPLTVIDCTGITKVNDLIANPLSVQEATCLIYNCRRQVPNVKPEPYHGSVSHAVNYRGGASGSAPLQTAGFDGPPATSSQNYEMLAPSSLLGGAYPIAIQPQTIPPAAAQSPLMLRYGAGYNSYMGNMGGTASMYSPMSALAPRGIMGGPSLMLDRHRGPIPYALLPTSSFPFGPRKYKMALMPLFK